MGGRSEGLAPLLLNFNFLTLNKLLDIQIFDKSLNELCVLLKTVHLPNFLPIFQD